MKTENVEKTRDVSRELEAVLMVTDQPQSAVELASALGVPVSLVREAIADLVADFDGKKEGPQRGFELREVGGGWRVYVRDSYDSIVSQVVHDQTQGKLSGAALETLAVVAYKQPVTRGQVSARLGRLTSTA
jgi:segregation and condensation protein B